ncbi:MAG: hypothetical protein RLZ33_1691 [Bacteroidota bacterium]
MLRTLRIQNFALIDQIELNFNAGYSVITGETGSGKSILLAALNLILGERADFSVIGPSSDKAIVEAEFSLNGFQLNDYFKENDLDFEELTVIRREINTSGKSRAFINDTPVSLNVLKELTGSLVNIHSQYNTLELKSRTYQLEIVDTLGDLKGEAESFAKNYKSLSTLSSELKRLNEQLSTALQQQDYNAFQLKELEELNLERTDFNSLEGELLKSENSEGILSALQAIEAVVEGENQVLDRLRIVKASLDKIKGVDKDVDELASRIQSSMIELADIAADAQRFSGQIEIDPAKLVELTSVLNRYNHALKKHNLLDQAALLEFKNQLESSVVGTTDLQSEIERLTQNFSKEKVAVETAAKKLHAARLKAIEPISKSIQAILVELKLPNTKLDFKLTERDELNSNGCTDIVLNFSANLGIETVPIEKAASGGELARVMLALQKLISEKRLLPTVLFDEIDTGVSGDVAQKIGALLQKMGDHFQLFAISHLPQVAAKAAHHFRVEKEIINNRTTTRVAVLNEQERIEEIARLMSGELITDAAIENAKALMN